MQHAFKGAKLASAGQNSLKSLKKNPPGLTNQLSEVKEKSLQSLSRFPPVFAISLVLYLRKMRLKKMRLMKNSSFLNAFILKLKDSAA